MISRTTVGLFAGLLFALVVVLGGLGGLIAALFFGGSGLLIGRVLDDQLDLTSLVARPGRRP
ncbi:MAG: hypothetical protein JWN54_756 [Mycobacterium sp.]|nr:hypothetical protein [Mycobacterium sp.]